MLDIGGFFKPKSALVLFFCLMGFLGSAQAGGKQCLSAPVVRDQVVQAQIEQKHEIDIRFSDSSIKENDSSALPSELIRNWIRQIDELLSFLPAGGAVTLGVVEPGYNANAFHWQNGTHTVVVHGKISLDLFEKDARGRFIFLQDADAQADKATKKSKSKHVISKHPIFMKGTIQHEYSHIFFEEGIRREIPDLIERFRSLEKSSAQYERLYDFVSRFHESFADNIPMIVDGDPRVNFKCPYFSAISNKLAVRRLKARDYSRKVDPDNWIDDEPHVAFAPFNSFVWNRYLKNHPSFQRRQQVAEAVYQALLKVLKKNWKNMDATKLQDLNLELMSEIELRLG